MRRILKAKLGDYPEYAEMYMKWTPDDGMILERLANNFAATKRFICALPEEKLLYRYKKDKWSIKEILVHIIDDERIYAYRAMCYARNEQTGLPGFDQEMYTAHAEADNRNLESIFEEYEAVRNGTIALFNGLPENALDRKGKGTGSFAGATPRALLFHIAGHELHHINFIKQNYLQ
jgi:uncharacterized damage-inducible protein DinB